MLSRKSIMWIFPVIILLAIGIVSNIWQFFIILIPIIIFYSLSYMFILPKSRVNVLRKVDRTRVSDGDEIHVKLFVKNVAKTIPILEIYDICPNNAIISEGTNRILVHINKDETVILDYTIKMPIRGEYKIGPTQLLYQDVNFMQFSQEIVANDIALTVLPKMEDIRKIKFKPKHVRNWPGLIKSKRIGLGTEFSSLRDYLPGDDWKRINWKASARMDRLITNEYEGERCADVIIILDARDESTIGSQWGNTTEIGVKAAISISHNVLKEKNRVGLIIVHQYLDWVYPAFGKMQFLKIADRLTRVSPGGIWSIEYLKWIAIRFFPPKSYLLIISPLTDRKIVDIIIQLCRRDFTIEVISPSPIVSEMSIIPKTREYFMAVSIVNMERSLILSELRNYTNVIDWNTSEPLAIALMEGRS